MTGPELDAARVAIGWTRAELARRLGRSPQQVDAMVWGKRPVQDWIARYVQDVRKAVDTVSVPQREDA